MPKNESVRSTQVFELKVSLYIYYHNELTASMIRYMRFEVEFIVTIKIKYLLHFPQLQMFPLSVMHQNFERLRRLIF